MKALIFLCVLLAVPLLGLITSYGIVVSVEANLSKGGAPVSVAEVCANTTLRANRDVGAFCNQADELFHISDASIASGLAALALPILYWLSSILLGSSRIGLAWFFPLIVRLSLIALAVIIAVQAGILVGSVYVAEAYFVGRIHGGLLILIGLGAVAVSLRLMWTAFTLGRPKETLIDGVIAERDAHPKLHEIVKIIAKKLKARQPDNIVIGLEPTFFATSAKIRLPNRPRPLTGETLFISLPLSRLFTIDEFVSVIGHELGHFRGSDTAYSLKFAPVYAGLSDALNKTAGQAGNHEHGAHDLMKLPAVALLSFMLEMFSRNESAISRKREYAADRAATEVAPPDALASALIKTAAYAPFWNTLLGLSRDRVVNNELFQNLSTAFFDLCRFDLDLQKLSERIDDFLCIRIVHPTDSHPPIGDRIRNLGVSLPITNVQALLGIPSTPASLSFGNLEVIEKTLTLRRHKTLAALGVYQMPKENEPNDQEAFWGTVTSCVYSLGAAIANTDNGLSKHRAVAASAASFLSNFGMPFEKFAVIPRNPSLRMRQLTCCGPFSMKMAAWPWPGGCTQCWWPTLNHP